MAKGFRIEYNGIQINADEVAHEVQKWSPENPDANIFKAVNGDLDIISEGSKPEFEILFFNLTADQYSNILQLHSNFAIFTTETQAAKDSIVIDNMFASVKPINVSSITLLPGLLVNLESKKTGAIIDGRLIENVCFMTDTDYQEYEMTDDGSVIVYRE